VTLDPSFSALDWSILGGCALVALILCVAGILRVVPRAHFLQKRVELYKYLPVLRAIEESRVRLERTAQNLGEATVLVARAQTAIEQVQVAIAGLLETAAVLAAAFNRVQAAVDWVKRFLGFSSRALRSRGS